MAVDPEILASAATICELDGDDREAITVREAIGEIRELRCELARAREALATYSRDYVVFTKDLREARARAVPAWTREKPTEPEWYWVRLREHDRPEVVWVDGKGNTHGVWGPLTLSGYEWAGPLPRPAEPEAK